MVEGVKFHRRKKDLAQSRKESREDEQVISRLKMPGVYQVRKVRKKSEFCQMSPKVRKKYEIFLKLKKKFKYRKIEFYLKHRR